jgi:hypothetical protein
MRRTTKTQTKERVMKTQITKKQASKKIAELIKNSFVDGGAYYIGMNDDGDIDYWYSTSDLSNMVVEFVDLTGREWKFGEFDGEPECAEDWDEETINGLAQCFESDWINEAISNHNNDVDIDDDENTRIEWKKDPIGEIKNDIIRRRDISGHTHCVVDGIHIVEQAFHDCNPDRPFGWSSLATQIDGDTVRTGRVRWDFDEELEDNTDYNWDYTEVDFDIENEYDLSDPTDLSDYIADHM